MKAATVCVSYYNILKYTLPYNRHYFSDYLIVTDTKDTQTQRLARMHNCQLHITDSFYSHGADFNKWLALEEGLEGFGKQGWMCMLDADIFLPKEFNKYEYLQNTFYTPIRRMCPLLITDLPEPFNRRPQFELTWWDYPPCGNQREFAGYCHIVHSNNPYLPKTPNWYELDWTHAGGADSFFQQYFPPELKVRPSYHVLHVGPTQWGKNWCGISPLAQAKMDYYKSLRIYPRNPDTYKHEKIRLPTDNPTD